MVLVLIRIHNVQHIGTRFRKTKSTFTTTLSFRCKNRQSTDLALFWGQYFQWRGDSGVDNVGIELNLRNLVDIILKKQQMLAL